MDSFEACDRNCCRIIEKINTGLAKLIFDGAQSEVNPSVIEQINSEINLASMQVENLNQFLKSDNPFDENRDRYLSRVSELESAKRMLHQLGASSGMRPQEKQVVRDTSRLNLIRNDLDQTLQKAIQTQELALDTYTNLENQGSILAETNSSLLEMNSKTKKTKSILVSMKLRMLSKKFVLLALIVILLIGNVLIVVFGWFVK